MRFVETNSPLLNSLKEWTAHTANGAVTNPTTRSAVLDLFFLAWASRNMEKADIESVVSSAYNEDNLTTLKILFWARDVRGGAGERRMFRIGMNYLVNVHPELITKFRKLIPEYWRWDDMWLTENMGSYTSNLDETALHIAKLLQTLDFLDLNNMLLCKWLPRKGKLANAIIKNLRWTNKQYRKFIVSNTAVVEQFMSAKKWEDIDLSKVPSKAFNKYKKAFERHLWKTYEEFIQSVINWENKLNAKTLFPYEIVHPLRQWDGMMKQKIQTAIAQRASLAQYTGNGSVLPVVDVSGSMESWIGNTSIEAIDISISLGIYLSEHINGPFKDHFISFSGKPHLHKLSGTIADKVTQVKRSWEDMSTNLIGVFECILNVAKRDNLSQEDMPKTVVIFSDMEFNQCGNCTNFNKITQLYKEARYTLPQLVFWNLNGRLNNYPVQWTTPNTVLLSWFSPALLRIVLEDNLNPYDAMMKTLNNERYDLVEETFK